MSAKRVVSKGVPSTGVARREGLLAEVRRLILEAREQTARAVNAGLTLLYWKVGERIRREVLSEKRAGYGEQIVATLSRQLEQEFGRGFAEKNLRRMVQFAKVFPSREIVVSLIRELTWTHFIALIPLKPIIALIMVKAGYDPIWFAVLIVILMETAMITPPVGINLYVVQGLRTRGRIDDVIIGSHPSS